MSKDTPLDLSNVTIVAADTAQPALAARALDVSISQCAFGDAILFTDAKARTEARTVKIPRLKSKGDYSLFMLKELVRHVTTPYVLVVQWDGYVVDAAAWSDAFFEYDYIGAPWPMFNDERRVGNGGFSLRSKRLLDAVAQGGFQFPSGEQEDRVICRTYGRQLEVKHGIRFAPIEIAQRFSYEYSSANAPTFGFHGPVNIARHADEEALASITSALDIRTILSAEVLHLMLTCCDLRRFACVKVLYKRYRKIMSIAQVFQWISRFVAANLGANAEPASRYVEICERLTSGHSDQVISRSLARELRSIPG